LARSSRVNSTALNGSSKACGGLGVGDIADKGHYHIYKSASGKRRVRSGYSHLNRLDNSTANCDGRRIEIHSAFTIALLALTHT
jgi:hypothetical protein